MRCAWSVWSLHMQASKSTHDFFFSTYDQEQLIILICTHWNQHFSFYDIMVSAFHPYFQVLDLVTGQAELFTGNYTFSVIGGSQEDLADIKIYDQVEQEFYNLQNQYVLWHCTWQSIKSTVSWPLYLNLYIKGACSDPQPPPPNFFMEILVPDVEWRSMNHVFMHCAILGLCNYCGTRGVSKKKKKVQCSKLTIF